MHVITVSKLEKRKGRMNFHKIAYLCNNIYNEREYNYIIRSYRDVIVVTKIATRRTSKAPSIVMY